MVDMEQLKQPFFVIYCDTTMDIQPHNGDESSIRKNVQKKLFKEQKIQIKMQLVNDFENSFRNYTIQI